MRVLIIGGTGFTGPHVATGLAELGHEVTLFHRGRTEAPLSPDIRHLYCPSGVLGDRRYFAEFTQSFREIGPDIVLDMIPVTEDDARTVVEMFRGVARRIVAISSQDVYRAYGVIGGTETDPPEPGPFSETASLRTRLFAYRGSEPRSSEDPRRWMDDYEKILVERTYLSAQDLPGTILRLPMIYGPRDKQHRMHEYLRRMTDGRPAILLEEGLAGWRWTRGYAESVAAAIVLAVTDERAAGRIYNVGEAEALSTSEWVQQIARAAAWDGVVAIVPKHLLPDRLQPQMNTDQDLVTDSSSIREELGYAEPVSLELGISRTVEWERQNPPEQTADLQQDYASEDSILAVLGRQKG
jgi:nucleoside-diphosphate-sugar epimerase